MLFITGYPGTALQDRLALGMEVTAKPVTLDALAAKISSMLDEPPNTRQH